MEISFEEKFKELQENQEFIEKMEDAKTAGDFIAIYEEFDIELTAEEAEEIVASLKAETQDVADEEFKEEQLDEVSGGLAIAGVVIPAILWKTALALVVTCGVVAGIKKLKKEFKKYF